MEKVYSTYQHQSKNFNSDKLKDYTLQVFIQRDLIIYSILSEEGKILAVKEYRTKSPQEPQDFLEEVMQVDNFLKLEYSSVRIIQGEMEFSLVPERFFKDSSKSAFAKILISKEFNNDSVNYSRLTRDEAVAVFTVPYALRNKCDFHFRNPEYIPFCQPAIQMSYDLPAGNGDLLLLSIFEDRFVITGIRENRLQICNAYDYSSVADIAYFTQLVGEVIKLKGKDFPIYLTGEFEEDSNLVQQLRKYIPDLLVPRDLFKKTFDTQSDKLPTWKYAFMTY